MKNKIASVILSVLFVSLIFVPTILFLVMGETTEGTLEEKRTLSERPAQFNNDFFGQLENWYNDHAPYRMTIITYQKEVSQKFGVFYRNTIHPLLSRAFTPSWYNEEYSANVPGGEPFLAPLEDNSCVYGRNEWLFYSGDENMNYFKGNNLLTEDKMAYWKSVFQELNDLCCSKGIRLVVFLAPNKEQVYGEYVPSYHIESNVKRAQQFYEYMHDSGVTYIYPLDELIRGKNLYDTYYKQDTHWNNIGAYIGVSEILKALGSSALPIDELAVQSVMKTGGDLSNFSGYSTEYADYIVNYKPEINVSLESYEDGNIEIFTSSATSNSNLVMLSDSFRSASKGYLSKEFARSVVTHVILLENETIIKEIKALSEGDVLLLLRVERYDAEQVETAKRLISILSCE